MVAQLVKPLKPKKLKVDKVRLNILNALRKEGRVVKRELEKTTATWKGAKPTFKIAIGLWVWLDEGTKPHVIAAKNVPNLIFRTDFKAKTKIKTFSSGPGNHPGIEARGWSIEIVRLRRKPFTKALIKASSV
jgi:hypothetical protein